MNESRYIRDAKGRIFPESGIIKIEQRNDIVTATVQDPDRHSIAFAELRAADSLNGWVFLMIAT